MAKDFSIKFYKSKAWQSCRKAYISQRLMLDGGLCERCHDKPGFILHHKTELNPTNIGDADITLNFCNLEYVCKACHDDIHFTEMHKMEPAVCFDSNGRIIPERE